MDYIERIGNGGARGIVNRVGARGLGEVGEAGPEVLDQLFIRLLRIGPATAVSLGTVPELCCATRTSQHAVVITRVDTATGEAYRFRNIAGKLGAEGLPIQEHRESVRSEDGEAPVT
jgi:hypothetical protein